MTDELKPCPFCGGKARVKCSIKEDLWGVACYKCECCTKVFFSEEEAVEAWNRRVNDD